MTRPVHGNDDQRRVRPLDHEPLDFAVMRTPLLSFDELLAWGEGLEAPTVEASGDTGARDSGEPSGGEGREELAAALGRDRERLRRRLRELAARPEVREALFVASPALVAGLEKWRRRPDGKKGKRAEDALVRYLVRMTSRATPFGLFSGCSLIGVGEKSRLRLGPRGEYRRRSRLDMGYLSRLQEELAADHGLRRALTYRTNTSLYRAAGRLRYAEARMDGDRRTYDLVAVDPDPFVELVLREARDGVRVAELAALLVDADPEGEVETAEAEAFVHELIDNQLLVSDLEPVITGGDALADLLAQLRRAGAEPALLNRLSEVEATLGEIDRGGVGAAPDRYRQLATSLDDLPVDAPRSRLFQVDMIKPATEAVVGEDVVAEIRRGLSLLYQLGGRSPNDELLERFRQRFTERYGADRQVPLIEALDEETGIGIELGDGDDAPLLAGLNLPGRGDETRIGWGPVRQRLLRLLAGALDRGDRVLEIAESSLAGLADDDAPPPADGLEALVSLAAASPEALAGGDFQVLVRGVFGPSGARLLTRFCHAEPALAPKVRQVLAAEQALDPEAIFAEVVHLPQGRTGNILSRPLLRDAEIPFLGRSGAPDGQQIPLRDLTVTVSAGRIVLRSATDGRRVVPRLTTAHNYSLGALGLYHFLGALQSQGVRSAFSWDWGPLESFPFLPRVQCGRLVLSRARWLLDGDDLAAFDHDDEAARYAAVQSWRRRRRVPRWVVLPEGDNELVVDLDNPLSIDSFLDLVGGRRGAPVRELFPSPDEMCADGPEGRFAHELLVPLVSRRAPTTRASARDRFATSGDVRAKEAAGGAPASDGRPADLPAPIAVCRSYPPGSEWLYARLYTGVATADRVLSQVVARVIRPALDAGEADRWFFLRYGDPDFHLRLRLHGDPAALTARLLPRLEDTVAPLLADGQVWKLELGTYEREVERYGGPAGIAAAERWFHADSEAVSDVLEHVSGDAAAEDRWRLALVGVDRLLDDLGLEGDDKLRVLAAMKRSFAREHRADSRLKKQMSDRLRGERKSLERLLDTAAGPGATEHGATDHPLAPALTAFGRRAAAGAAAVAELRRAADDGRLDGSIARLATSFAHMHLNRMLRSHNRAQEMVIYDFLYRIAHSRKMRRRALAGAAS